MTDTATRYDVRSLRRGEEERFLTRMCECFALNIDNARPIFYNDPFFDLSHKKVLVDSATGQIISSLTIVPSAVRVSGGALIPVAGLAGVCTSPTFQGKGYAQRLIRDTIQTAPSEFGYAAAALSTDRPEIYRAVGFESCSSVVHWSAHRSLLPAFREADHASMQRFDEIAPKLPEIKALYDHAQASQPGVFIRDDRRWATIEASQPDYSVIIWQNNQHLDGCIICRMKEHRGDRVLEILDLLASNAAARRGLIGFIRNLENIDIVSGQTRASDLRKLGIQDIPRFTSYRREGVMMAIMDFDACLSLVAATGGMTPVIRRSDSGLTIRLENSLSVKDRKPLRLFSVSTDRIGVAIGIAPADEMAGDWISADTGAMSQLFFGHFSASKLRSRDRLWISSESALAIADSLFPAFDTFLGPLDAF